jgi:hypothetical protein
MFEKVQQDITRSNIWSSILETKVPPSSPYSPKLDPKLQSFINILASIFKMSEISRHKVQNIISEFQGCPLLFETIDEEICQEKFSTAIGHIKTDRTAVNKNVLKLEENEGVDVERIVLRAIEIAQYNCFEN